MAGNFHIAPGASFSIDHYHFHDFHIAEFKLTHTINHLSFGEKIEFANTHPLDGMHVEANEGKLFFSFFFNSNINNTKHKFSNKIFDHILFHSKNINLGIQI